MVAAAPILSTDGRPYRPTGNHVRLWACRDPIVVYEGPAGTGKTRSDLEKINACAEKYPGSRQMILRNERSSLTHTVLPEFEGAVLPIGHPARRGARADNRSAYYYPNGSVVVLGGLDDVDKVLSSQMDRIVVFEATDTAEADIQQLLTRLRNGVLPYQQLVLECNPKGPQHWINQWASKGRATRIRTTHRDNPRYWDEDAGDWTDEGRAYVLGILSKLEGTARARMFEGRWVAAEGLVYDTFSREIHVGTDDAPPKRVLISVDDGYSDPFSAHRYHLDSDRRIHVKAERYARGLLFEDKRRAIAELGGAEAEAILVDAAAAALIAELRQHFPNVVACDKRLPIVEGIGLVRERLRVQGDGRPRLTVDPSCRAMLDEMDTYEWKRSKEGQAKDVPVDQCNHALDDLRYLVVHEDAGSQPFVEVASIGGVSARADVWGDDDRLWRAL